jgi:hypothetical protein
LKIFTDKKLFFIKGEFFDFLKVLYSKMLHLPAVRFYCVVGHNLARPYPQLG